MANELSNGPLPSYAQMDALSEALEKIADNLQVEINLNGQDVTSPAFYAPTASGTQGQILTSGGNAAPVWTDDNNVKTTAQTLTDEQKQQARANIGAITADEAKVPVASQTQFGTVKVYTDSDGYLNIDTE